MLRILLLLFVIKASTASFIQSRVNYVGRKIGVRDPILDFVRYPKESCLKEIMQEICIPRVVGTEGHKKVENYITTELEKLKWIVHTDEFKDTTPTKGIQNFTNIIAYSDVTAPRHLVFACHYDSKIFKGFMFEGATDSAVPCSMQLALAHELTPILSQNTTKRNRDIGIVLLFLDGEEAFDVWSSTDSIYGARHLAARWADTKYTTQSGEIIAHLDRIDLFILLDLLGAPNPSFFNLHLSTRPWYKRLVEIEKALVNSGISKQKTLYFRDSTIQAQIEDDHLPFMRRGVPILHLIPIPFPNTWHTRGDTCKSIDYDVTEDIMRILEVFIAEYLHFK